MEQYIKMLRDKGANWAEQIEAHSVVTAPWTILRCQFGCDFYGKRYSCPPRTPSWRQTQEMIDCYDYGILFRCDETIPVTPLAVQVARSLFLDDYYKVISFGSGPCLKCKECGLDHCHLPKEVVPAMEACGIDVFATVRNNGLELHTVKERGDPQCHFGLILVE